MAPQVAHGGASWSFWMANDAADAGWSAASGAGGLAQKLQLLSAVVPVRLDGRPHVDAGVELRLAGEELRRQPGGRRKSTIDFATRTSGFFVMPDGSKRAWLNLSTSTCSGTPYCSEYEIACANASAKPEMVEPSLAITRKISPGVPSSNRPTVT